jgi:7-cyano-7-deazaguanine reductase
MNDQVLFQKAQSGDSLPPIKFRSPGKQIMNDEYSDLTLLKRSATVFPAGPENAKLETFPNRYDVRDYLVEFDCPEFTSMCPITGQPDFAKIKISYVPDKRCIESKSLKLYLFSFRNTGMFHEEITNRILDDVVVACKPKWALVRGTMNPRGGITIDVRAEYFMPGRSKETFPFISKI